MPTTLSKQYDPSHVEPLRLRQWLSNNYFHADATEPAVPYSVTLPPPNVTGSLHMGHALGFTLQDILVRWKRMQRFNAMWMPGTDHAGIATQMLVERDLRRRDDKSRHDIGREAFVERVWKWKERYGGRIAEQMKVMGFSLDWERERFTMDDAASASVREDFVRLYEEGLIYRAHRLINWCSDCFTAVSDLEVNKEEESGHLWELYYPIVGTDRRITVATTRPETMLGDTAVAVHPDDERYTDVVGKMVQLPLCDRQIPIVADSFVEREFGSGAVKVTPGHDQNDFDCGKRNDLEVLSILDQHGKIVDPAPAKYHGMTAREARKAVVADLGAVGLLGEIKDHAVPLGRCDRSKTIIEPMLSEQWFVKTEPLAKPAIEAVEKGKTKFIPELWTKTYMHWMTNIRDWCISRQLWWGHRIPAWYCDDCDEVIVSRTDPTSCTKCDSASIRQDEDVLDTWFSSALWPFSTLGWPEKTRELRTFYPNAVLVTGPDIIFFWVARMMMMGLYHCGKVPFRTVFLTPIVTDAKGVKMSKVKGNVVDPLDVIHGATLQALVDRATAEGHTTAIEEIKKNFPEGINAAGADALRFSLAAMTVQAGHVRLSMERVEGYRNFINKLWNASRFTLMNLSDYDPDRFERVSATASEDSKLSLADRWIMSRLQRVCAEVDEALTAFRFSDAANALYQFVWHELCDWYIELAKPFLYADADATEAQPDAQERRVCAQGTLATVLDHTLRLLHPIAPYVTEEIWQKLPKSQTLPASLMVTIYPRGDAQHIDAEVEEHMAVLQSVTVAIRMLRSTYSVPPSWSVPVEVRAADVDKRALLDRHRSVIENAAKVTMTLKESGEHIPQSAKTIVGSDVEVVVPLAGLVDIDAEKTRISKQIAKTDKEIARVSKKLSNEKFLERAPEDIISKERAKLVDEQSRKERLAQALSALV